jgi:peptidoglycan hydrolase-like protein with peptidoglycan-binding domain
MSRDVLDEAYRHFELSGKAYEYGRPDMTLNRSRNPTDASRTEQDLDGDGRRGVDCSSLVWRGLKDAGYDVGNTPFSTSRLFTGSTPSDYARSHFDVIPGSDAGKSNGSLQPGDVLMFNSSHGRHVGIFSGYDDKGHIQFYGSQVSTGPALVSGGAGGSTAPGGYWNGGDFQIVGALRPKPEFRTGPALHAGEGPVTLDVRASRDTGAHAPAAGQPAARARPADAMADGVLSLHDKGQAVTDLQTRLAAQGFDAGKGKAFADGDFGPTTKGQVEAFQRAQGLTPVDGIAGRDTLGRLDQLERARGTGAAEHAAPTPARDAVPTSSMAHPDHPDHARYGEAVGKLQALEQQRAQGGQARLFEDPQQLERMAGQVVFESKVSGMHRIDSIVARPDGQGVFAVQGQLGDPSAQRVYVDQQQAKNQSVEQSTQQAAALTAQFAPPQVEPKTRQPAMAQ